MNIRKEFIVVVETAFVDVLKFIIPFGITVGISYWSMKLFLKYMDQSRGEKDKMRTSTRNFLRESGINVDISMLSEHELYIASNLVDTRHIDVTWDDIGGLQDTIEKLKENVLSPLKYPKLYSGSSLLQPPRGVLLYGPPGCGKTLICKALAKDSGARFICLQSSNIVDKWYGETQKLTAAIFSLAAKLQPTIVFIDEIDSLMRVRRSTDHEATAMMKTEFMNLWDGLKTNSVVNVIIIGATNLPSEVDSAILRRMPCRCFIDLPNEESRKSIVNLFLKNEKVDVSLSCEKIAQLTSGFSGSDLREVCRNAAITAVQDSLRLAKNDSDICRRNISMSDLENSIKIFRKSNTIKQAPASFQLE